MDRLFGAMAFFIEYPVLAAAIGVVVLGLGRRAHRRIAVGAGIAWLLYGLYEFGMKQRWLCSGECNIRIDLLLIYPLLVIGLVAAAVSLLRAPAGPRPTA
jgi:formate hydrogenlyase subunit 3/multisubunit Na+/H+ antiporter MnhD subunit